MTRAFALATLTNAKTCVVLKDGNMAAGYGALEDLAGSTNAFCGDPRAGLSIYDIDEETGVKYCLKAAHELENQGYLPVIFESSEGTGRAHLWVPYDTLEEYELARSICKEIIPKLEDRTRTKIRPPMSPSAKAHRRPMKLIHPESESEALRRLKTGKGPKPKAHEELEKDQNGSVNRVTQIHPLGEQGPRKLSSEELAALQMRHPKGSRSEPLCAFAGHCKSTGWTEEEFLEHVLAHPQGLGAKAYSKRNPAQWLSLYVWGKVAPRKGSSRSPEFVRTMQTVKEAASAYVPPKRQIGSNSLLMRLIERIEKKGSLEFHLSEREAGALTGSNQDTGKRRIGWLQAQGWLERTKPGTKVKAAEYRLTIPEELKRVTLSDTPPSPPKGCVSECPYEVQGVLAASDAFVGWSMGLKIMSLVTLGRSTVKQIADELGRKRSTIQRTLDALELFGLVNQRNGEYSSNVQLSTATMKLEMVARARGKLGRLEQARTLLRVQAKARRDHLQVMNILGRSDRENLQLLCQREAEGGRPPRLQMMTSRAREKLKAG